MGDSWRQLDGDLIVLLQVYGQIIAENVGS